jgi:cholesterol oxidase
LDIDWRMRRSSGYFRQVHQTMAEIADALEGKLLRNPLSYLSHVITVHPLGGCPMGRTAEEGVIDANGQVFNHSGLYVADGSVMPGPTGPNPSLTIAALADRFADHLIDHARRPQHQPHHRRPDRPLRPSPH